MVLKPLVFSQDKLLVPHNSGWIVITTQHIFFWNPQKMLSDPCCWLDHAIFFPQVLNSHRVRAWPGRIFIGIQEPAPSFKRLGQATWKSKMGWFRESPPKEHNHLVGGWTSPSEKYARQIGSFPQVGLNIKNLWVATTQSLIWAKKNPKPECLGGIFVGHSLILNHQKKATSAVWLF